MDANEQFDSLVKEYLDRIIERHPEVATYLGIHKYDDRLSSATIEALEEDIRELEEFKGRLEEIPFERLDEGRKVDYRLLLRAYEMEMFYYRDYPLWKRFPAAPDNVGGAIFMVLVNERLPVEHRAKSVVGRLREAARYIRESRERLLEPVRIYLDIGLETGRGLLMMFQSAPALIESMGVEMGGVDSIAEMACKELESYLETLEELKRDAREEYAIGEEGFNRLLKLKGVPYDAKTMERIGREYLERYKRLREELARRLGFKSVDEALEHIKSEHPKSFDEVLNLYSKMVREAREFVEKTGFAPLPPGEKVKIVETPIFLRPVIPFAAYIPPGKFEEDQVGIFLVTPPQTEDAYKEHNFYGVNNTVVHEAYPGHHLQLAWANRHPSLARLLGSRRAAETVEGWAHYCEEAVREAGFYNDEKHMIIVYTDAIWRAVRVIVDVGLHCRGMSFEEAVDFLVKEVGMTREQALAEVKRYTYTPTYQTAYLIGKHLLRELAEEARGVLGEKFSLEWFHRAILEEATLPYDMLREVVLEKARKFKVEGPGS